MPKQRQYRVDATSAVSFYPIAENEEDAVAQVRAYIESLGSTGEELDAAGIPQSPAVVFFALLWDDAEVPTVEDSWDIEDDIEGVVK